MSTILTSSILPISPPNALRLADVPVVEATDTCGISLYDDPPPCNNTLATPPLIFFVFVMYESCDALEYPTFSGTVNKFQLKLLVETVVIP